MPFKIVPFELSFATHEKAKHWSSKNTDAPKDIYKASDKKRWFDCNICNHEFESKLSNISHGRWCPYCCNPSKLLCNNDSCMHCFNRSFASHEKASCWSTENAVSPREILKGSAIKYKFVCKNCSHLINLPVNAIIRGNWCSYCSNDKLCTNEDCKICFNKSFASHEKSKYWSNNNNISPRYVFKGSNKQKYKFECNKCLHTFETTPNAVFSQNSWCNYCDNIKLCAKKECITCYHKTVQSMHVVKHWSNKNEKHPRFVFKYENTKYIFDCPHCNKEYIATPNAINARGTWCTCKNKKSETRLFEWLKTIYTNVRHNCYVDWCVNPDTNCKLPYDFIVNDNIVVELDGNQHFIKAGNWTDPETTKQRDVFKMKCATNKNMHVIRLFQKDVWENKLAWKEDLKNAIDKLSTCNTPTIKYLSDEAFYKKWFNGI